MTAFEWLTFAALIRIGNMVASPITNSQVISLAAMFYIPAGIGLYKLVMG